MDAKQQECQSRVKRKDWMTSGLVFDAKIFNGGNMGRNLNVNVREASERSYINVKVKEKRSGSNLARIRRAQNLADELVRKFGPASQSSYKYFCKLSYQLPQNVIWDCYEQAHSPRIANSLAYFLAATKAQLQIT